MWQSIFTSNDISTIPPRETSETCAGVVIYIIRTSCSILTRTISTIVYILRKKKRF